MRVNPGLREEVLDELIGDMEHHPKRGLVYLVFGVSALAVWVLAPFRQKVAVIPLMAASGGAILLLKGLFFLRKSSEGLTRSLSTFAEPHVPIPPKPMPALTTIAARLVQDLGAGCVLAGPLLHHFSPTPTGLPLPWLGVFAAGAVLFFAGVFVRHLLNPEFP